MQADPHYKQHRLHFLGNFFGAGSRNILLYWFPNKLPQVWWLKTMGIYPLTCEGWTSQTEGSAGMLLPEGLRKGMFCASPSSWWLLPMLGAPWLIAAPL